MWGLIYSPVKILNSAIAIHPEEITGRHAAESDHDLVRFAEGLGEVSLRTVFSRG